MGSVELLARPSDRSFELLPTDAVRRRNLEDGVTRRVILHEIARDEDGIGHGQVTGSVRERALERLERIDTAQGRRRIAKQVGIGELDDSDGTHSAELYKHAAMRRVMRVTASDPTLHGGEPGRKLPRRKRETASS